MADLQGRYGRYASLDNLFGGLLRRNRPWQGGVLPDKIEEEKCRFGESAFGGSGRCMQEMRGEAWDKDKTRQDMVQTKDETAQGTRQFKTACLVDVARALQHSMLASPAPISSIAEAESGP